MDSQHTVVHRGGDDLERLYLYDHTIQTEGKRIQITKSDFPGANMADIIMRHIGRYGLALPFIRPGFRVLDFPCGSGLALEAFDSVACFGQFSYEGWDNDNPTILYAREVYGEGRRWAAFAVRDLTNFSLVAESYDTICCIEGIEHIPPDAQVRACAEFAKALKPDGTFIISSPPPDSGISGPNPKNPFHLWEMTREDFLALLGKFFDSEKIELVSQKNLLSTRQLLTIHYAICHW